MKKKTSKLLKIFLFILLCPIVAYFAFIVFISGPMFLFMQKPELPEIKHGEFPIEFICEVDGKVQTVEDVLICKYAGLEWRGGYMRSWEEQFKSGNDRFVLLSGDENGVPFEIYTQYYGDANYYMEGEPRGFSSEEKYYEYLMQNAFNEFTYQHWINGEKIVDLLSAEDMWEMFDFRVISVRYPDPIMPTKE